MARMVSSNGRRSPMRPRIELKGSTASPEEAAAITAAIEQFIRDTAPPPATGQAQMNPWLRAALYENAGLDPANATAWGDGEPWGAR